MYSSILKESFFAGLTVPLVLSSIHARGSEILEAWVADLGGLGPEIFEAWYMLSIFYLY